jgi:hypothetical protein
MYRQRIAKLQQQVYDLEVKILAAEKDKSYDADALIAMSIEVIDVYSTLRKYKQLQWEEDHERVNFEDDR